MPPGLPVKQALRRLDGRIGVGISVLLLAVSVGYFVAWGNRWSIARNLAEAGAVEASVESTLTAQMYGLAASTLLIAGLAGLLALARRREGLQVL